MSDPGTDRQPIAALAVGSLRALSALLCAYDSERARTRKRICAGPLRAFFRGVASPTRGTMCFSVRPRRPRLARRYCDQLPVSLQTVQRCSFGSAITTEESMVEQRSVA